ncbi:MAG: transketolase family protein [Armatimonadetes bacterium]|nr:transketolase family protein [Armatimonadota bacterium]
MSELLFTQDAYGRALAELGEARQEIVVLDADVSKGTKTSTFAERFPERFFNVGCAEQNLFGTAAGLALMDMMPFASTFAMFACTRGLDQIRNTIAYPRLNVKVVATHGGITVGGDGASHQALEDVAVMRTIPNMTVIVPCDAPETEKAVRASVDWPGPVYIRLARAPRLTITDKDTPFSIGRGTIFRRGDDAVIIAAGLMVATAMEAAEMLAESGIETTVVNMHTIKPLDVDLVLELAQRTGCIVTAEEHSTLGGLGGAIAEVLSEKCPVPVQRIGVQDVFTESGKPQELLDKYGLSADHIATVVRQVIMARRS